MKLKRTVDCPWTQPDRIWITSYKSPQTKKKGGQRPTISFHICFESLLPVFPVTLVVIRPVLFSPAADGVIITNARFNEDKLETPVAFVFFSLSLFEMPNVARMAADCDFGQCVLLQITHAPGDGRFLPSGFWYLHRGIVVDFSCRERKIRKAGDYSGVCTVCKSISRSQGLRVTFPRLPQPTSRTQRFFAFAYGFLLVTLSRGLPTSHNLAVKILQYQTIKRRRKLKKKKEENLTFFKCYERKKKTLSSRSIYLFSWKPMMNNAKPFRWWSPGPCARHTPSPERRTRHNSFLCVCVCVCAVQSTFGTKEASPHTKKDVGWMMRRNDSLKREFVFFLVNNKKGALSTVYHDRWIDDSSRLFLKCQDGWISTAFEIIMRHGGIPSGRLIPSGKPIWM